MGDRVRLERELPEDLADVPFDGLELETELVGDPLVGPPLRHEPEDVALATGQLVERRVLARPTHEPGDDLGIDHRVPGRDAR